MLANFEILRRVRLLYPVGNATTPSPAVHDKFFGDDNSNWNGEMKTLQGVVLLTVIERTLVPMVLETLPTALFCECHDDSGYDLGYEFGYESGYESGSDIELTAKECALANGAEDENEHDSVVVAQ